MSASDDHARTAGDVIAVTVTTATVFGWLPAAVAVVTEVRTIIRVWETKTAQDVASRIFARPVRAEACVVFKLRSHATQIRHIFCSP